MKTTLYNWPRFLERGLPWLVLLILLTYTVARFVGVPYAGFLYDVEGQVVELYVNEGESEQLYLGDRLQVIGGTPWLEFATDPSLTLFDDSQSGDVVPIQIQRDEQNLTINWRFPGPTFNEVVQRLNSEWWLPFVFWLSGLATALLVRPHGTRWQLLIAFNFLTAIWLATGGFALTHVWGILWVFKTAVWLSLPVYLHLHWVFPHPWGNLPSWFGKAGYALTFILVVLEWWQLLPASLYQLGFLIALGGSLLLLFGRYFFRPSERLELNLFVLAIVLVFMPQLLFTVARLIGMTIPFYIQGGALMAFPAIPGIYFYTVYRHQLGRLQAQAQRLARVYVGAIFVSTLFIISIPAILNRFAFSSTLTVGGGVAFLAVLFAIISFTPFLLLPALMGAYETRQDKLRHRLEIRANRLLVPFLFVVLLAALSLTLAILGEVYLHFPGAPILAGTAVGVLSVVATGLGYTPFQRLVERHLLGIPLISEELSQQYLAHIIVSLSKAELVSILRNEVLPTLLIRQSALYYISDPQQKEPSGTTLYVQGFAPDELPQQCSMRDFLTSAEQVMNAAFPAPWAWVKLALPLHLSGQFVGVWLLGRRDPDDLYGYVETAVLQNIANQTAVALSHILQTDTLRALYQTNIDRQEAERKSLARNLHDEVLNRVTELAMYVDASSTNARFHQSYQKVTAYLRQTISGLRPAMLTYGLAAALEELVDELNDREQQDVVISFELDPAPHRYPENVEEHLYRITQQGVENALRHAQAQNVRIGGHFQENEIRLTVVDDGVGFVIEEPISQTALVSQKHFGIASMRERAELIGSQLIVETAPGQGTTMTVTWQNN